MKTSVIRLFLSGILFAMASGLAVYADDNVVPSPGQVPQYYRGVGPVMEGSCPVTDLPAPALDFIEKHFPYADVITCTRDYSDGEFDVTLQEGTELEFNHEGKWVEVEAGVMRRLSPVLLQQLIPEKAYKELEARKMIGEVEKVKRDKNGYKVSIREVKYDDFRFSSDGRLVSMKD